MNFKNDLAFAKNMDQQDRLGSFRKQFHFPEAPNGKPLYFAGHSLGLMPRKVQDYILEELDSWKKYGVEGHLKGPHPWLPYHENLTPHLAKLVGAKPQEVVAMNTLTVNLHLLMVSFYKPEGRRNKILIESNTFPSDKYGVDSQARFHGLDPRTTIVQLPTTNSLVSDEEEILAQIRELGSELSLVMLGNCNYLSGQKFNFAKIVEEAHRVGAKVGFNLAHGAGNLVMQLHDWNVDFAVWCSYKYLNAGAGAIAGAFIHEKHLGRKDLPRFEGWWGHDKQSRFKMGPDFNPIPTIEAWQLSNPPIFQLAALRASMELFTEATMPALREKGDLLTGYFEWLIQENLKEECSVVTPPERGSMLCLKFKKSPHALKNYLHENGVFVDFREPDIIRATPVPMYISFEDVFSLVQLMKNYLRGNA